MRKIGDYIVANRAKVDLVMYLVQLAFLVGALVAEFFSRNVFFLMSALIVGWALGTKMGGVVDAVVKYRQAQMFRLAPKSIRNIGEPLNGKVTVSVHLNNGDIRMVEVPEDYHPSQDNGDLVLRQAVPELFGVGAPLEGSLGGDWV